VILVASTTNLTAIRQATSTVPVVFVSVSDPVAQGFVASVRQPGGNITGFSRYEFSIGGKWLGLLKEAAPGLVRVAVMFNPDTYVKRPQTAPAKQLRRWRKMRNFSLEANCTGAKYVQSSRLASYFPYPGAWLS
jgi:ABC-type uncharacterized transport system substrate-binding protein